MGIGVPSKFAGKWWWTNGFKGIKFFRQTRISQTWENIGWNKPEVRCQEPVQPTSIFTNATQTTYIEGTLKKPYIVFPPWVCSSTTIWYGSHIEDPPCDHLEGDPRWGMGATGLESLWSSHTILPSRAFRGVSGVETSSRCSPHPGTEMWKKGHSVSPNREKAGVSENRAFSTPPNLMFYPFIQCF